MTRRLIAHFVVRNEAERFLDPVLNWTSEWVDDVHVYDDGSEDATLSVALRHTSLVGSRPSEAVSFAESESALRQLAWENMIDVCKPTSEDWIIALDADEFILGNNKETPREALETTADYVDAVGSMAAGIKRVMVWEWGVVPLVRVDGFWAKDRQTRLAKFNSKAKTFKKAALGCGSVPQYAMKASVATANYSTILDLGYSLEGEPERKHEFYATRSGDAHNANHIASIIQKPKLAEWRGPVPKVLS
jgi:Glycosyl transferase family 2